jgi:hypothetical protein
MNPFAERWRRLGRAAAAAGEPPLPPAPDGARLQRLAAAHRPAPRARRGLLPSTVALALLWAVALPAATTAWRTARDLAGLVAASAPVPALGALKAQAPPWPSVPAIAPPRLPPLPGFVARPPRGEPSPAQLRKETPP